MGELERVGGLNLIRRTVQRLQDATVEGTLAELLTMRALPETDEVRNQLADLRGQIACLTREAAFDVDRIRLGRRAAALEQQLGMAERRDRIVAGRPAGCWCLGAGGEGERGILAAGRVEDGAEPFQTFVRYCRCQEGADAERAAVAAQHAHDRWVIDSRRLRIWGQAKVPSTYDGLTLETWVEEVVRRGGDRQQATALIRALRRWLATTGWLLLLGPPSTGKTGIAIALMWELAGRGIGDYFVNASDMVMRIRGTFDRPDQSEVEMFDSLAEAPILVIDDLGKQSMTPYAMELFYRLFNTRAGNGRRTIVTSNLAKTEALKAHVGEAVYDRLIQVAKVAKVDPDVNLRLPRRIIAALE